MKTYRVRMDYGPISVQYFFWRENNARDFFDTLDALPVRKLSLVEVEENEIAYSGQDVGQRHPSEVTTILFPGNIVQSG